MKEAEKDRLIDELEDKLGIVGWVSDDDGTTAQQADLWDAVNDNARHVAVLRLPSSQQTLAVFSTKPLNRQQLKDYRAVLEIVEDE